MTDEHFNRGDGRSAGSTSDQSRHSQAGYGAGASTAGDVGQKVKEDVASARQAAADQMSKASAKAERAADQQKNFAARKVAGIASVIEKVGTDLEGQDEPEIGRMTRQIGESVHRVAGEIEGRSLGQIAAMAEDFGRKQPMAFLGIAAIAGLAASRFISASARHPAAADSSVTGAAGTSGKSTSSMPAQKDASGAARTTSGASASSRPLMPTTQTTPGTSGTGAIAGGTNG